MGEYDEATAISEVAEALRPSMVSDRFKYDQAAIEDVIRIIRGVGRANGNDLGQRQMNASLV
jgi:hypothetical protein